MLRQRCTGNLYPTVTQTGYANNFYLEMVKERNQIALLIRFRVSFAWSVWVLWEVCILLAMEL